MTDKKVKAAEAAAKPTRSQEVATDLVALLQARAPLIWVVTLEEARVERYLFEAAQQAKYVPCTWDVSAGRCDVAGRATDAGLSSPDLALEAIAAAAASGAQRNCWIMRDLPPWLDGAIGIKTLRQLRNLSRTLPGVPPRSSQAVIVLSPTGKVPDELAATTTVVDWPLPDRTEVAAELDVLVDQYGVDLNGARDAAIDAAVGLTGEEAVACYAKSLVQTQTITPAAVVTEKKRVIARAGVLEWVDPLAGGLDAVGGLDNLKDWLMVRSTAYTPAARAYGLQPPKGTLLAGISGCGKSLTAKAVATAWQVPLVKLDLGALKSKFVGDSEQQVRKALRVIEALNRCVVWVDEIEKSLAGATDGGADGGVSKDALGVLLNWMQERRGEAFLVATANDITGLPPEFLRKGRWDELWWVDLPSPTERAAVLAATFRRFKRDLAKSKIDVARVTAACNNFTGAEIDAIVPEALFRAFNDGGREPTTADLVEVAQMVKPLAETAKEKIIKMREMVGTGRLRAASSPEVPAARSGRRVIEM